MLPPQLAGAVARIPGLAEAARIGSGYARIGGKGQTVAALDPAPCPRRVGSASGRGHARRPERRAAEIAAGFLAAVRVARRAARLPTLTAIE